MEHLPESATLRARIAGEGVDAAAMGELARRLARFHDSAGSGPEVAASCTFEAIAANARENLDQAAPPVGVTLSRSTFDRLRIRTEAALADLREIIEDRARRGVPRDTPRRPPPRPRLLVPGASPPDDWIVVDCIEFDARFRHADPIADIAFLAMELALEGRRTSPTHSSRRYLRAAGDAEGRELLPFYRAYRAAVRGKVEGMKLAEPRFPRPTGRRPAFAREPSGSSPSPSWRSPPAGRAWSSLAGLPGTGKSTLARAFAERARFTVIRSDLVRKELASRVGQAPAPAAFAEDIYTPEWDERTYAECLHRAEEVVFQAGRVLVDASFREESRRRLFLDAARRWGIAGRLLLCQAAPEVVRRRLDQRHDDASDAGWAIYLEAARRWESLGEDTRSLTRDRCRRLALAFPRASPRRLCAPPVYSKRCRDTVFQI